MRYATFERNERTSAGVVRGESVIPVGTFPDLGTLLAATGADQVGHWPWGGPIPLSEVRLRAPILRPPKIVGVGLNYRDHAEEQNRPVPTSPLLFAKAPTAVIGPGDTIRLPREESESVDYEVELGVVVGTGGYRISKTEAMRHVLGYTIVLDISARDIQAREKQWFRAKSFATFAPLGPMVVSPDEADGGNLAISLKVNGEVRQQSRTSQMIFDVPSLVAFISACFALEAGDVIATGTPGGVGVFRNPQVFLKEGDVIEATIEKIGTLRCPVQ